MRHFSIFFCAILFLTASDTAKGRRIIEITWHMAFKRSQVYLITCALCSVLMARNSLRVQMFILPNINIGPFSKQTRDKLSYRIPVEFMIHTYENVSNVVICPLFS